MKILTKKQFVEIMDSPKSILYPNDTIRINGNLYKIEVAHPNDKVILEMLEEFEDEQG